MVKLVAIPAAAHPQQKNNKQHTQHIKNMKKIFILFAIFSLQIAPTFADITDMQRSMDASDIILRKYCASTNGNRLDCRTNQTSTTISGGCSEWKPDADKEQFLVDLKNWCNHNYDAISPETKPATATINNTDTIPTSDAVDTAPATGTITVSGTIADADETLIGATVMVSGTNNGTTTDLDGNFTLSNVPANASLEISYVGCTAQTLSAKSDMGTITLNCNHQLNEVTVEGSLLGTPCSDNILHALNAESGTWTSEDNVLYCDIQCGKNWTKQSGTYEIKNGDGKSKQRYKCECVGDNIIVNGACTPINNCSTDKNATTSAYEKQNDETYICKITECKKDWKPNADGTACIEMLKECTEDQKKQHPDALSTGIKKGTEECVATECKCGFDLTDGKCVAWPTDGVACNDMQNPKLPLNASAGTKQCDDKSAYCAVSACADGFKISDDKKSCISTRGDSCDATSVDKNATAGTNQNVNGKITCVITACGRGFKPNKNGTKCIAAELSEQDSLAKIDKLKDNAQKMRDKEQSTENKLLGAAGIGATGIGAMQMLSASAEQSADQDAEAAMRAYLATFHCNYGMGKNISGGEKQVELPGGNELIGLYAEYVNLANDLKIRKNALGMRAGIESEPILDSATSGLYDDIAIGKTSGAYTSLARAIMDPTGADAIAWAAQKSDSADKLKSGAITAGVGALGSLVGNLAINSGDAKKNKVNDIIAEFDKKKQKIFQDLESDIKKIPPQVEKCPNGTTGTKHPDCTCTGNAEYNTNTKSCDPCADGQTIVEGKCTCTGDTPLWDEQNKKCIKQPQQCTAKCTPSDGSHLVVQQDCSCICIDGFTIADDEQSCTCNEQTHEIKDNKCVKKSAPVKPVAPQPVAKPIVITLPADSLFELGKDVISDTAKPALNKFIADMKTNGIKNCKLTINGYTDGTGSTKFNQTLSENRANAVKNYLTSNGPDTFDATNITTNGMGEGSCSCSVAQVPSGKESDPDYKQCVGQSPNYINNYALRYAPCRRVTIELDSSSCQSTTGGDLGNIIQTVASNITQ